MKYDVVNIGPDLGQAQKCDSVKLVNGMGSLLITGSPTAIQI
jgi:hypothetical protein